mmetsp:Transcript_19663/g.44956  ORF Transcript_19663/g.44956 Transcript_19663/m.44956 type:complete len:205 (-) Transcript_19663:170-784(-)
MESHHLSQSRSGFRVVPVVRDLERDLPVGVPCVAVCSCLCKDPYHRSCSVRRRPMQRSSQVLVPCVHVGSPCDQHLHRLLPSFSRRIVQRGLPVLLVCVVHRNTGIQQSNDRLRISRLGCFSKGLPHLAISFSLHILTPLIIEHLLDLLVLVPDFLLPLVDRLISGATIAMYERHRRGNCSNLDDNVRRKTRSNKFMPQVVSAQ